MNKFLPSETVSQCHSEAIAEESDLRQQVILSKAKDLVPIAWIPRRTRDDALHRISPFGRNDIKSQNQYYDTVSQGGVSLLK